ncbi:MAG: 30S ribosomal protein S4, partial [Pseudothermotoga sp.]|uniref:30S ribosomal protein S4 n=1 Tax=Pseudothermotoga sp. TaxID=2033661 RepID=UPI00258770C0
GENLLRLLEMRLDNVVYRLGFGASRRQARQLVRHAHFLVNGKRVNIPSYLLKPGDIVEVKESSRSIEVIKRSVELAKGRTIAPWIQVDFDAYRGTFERAPKLEELTDLPVDVQAIVELYSR